ncbi:hypothetical protein ACFV5G_20500 [Streptomyces sp. NPDC059766]|uniref:hypothetical protein n=1 Tax=Streptomyces sp. NPDC059766 TaxID=3346940 RepID=UPI00365AF04E
MSASTTASASPTAAGPAAATARAERGHHADDPHPALHAGAARVQCPSPGERRSPPPALGTPGRTSDTLPPALDAPAPAVPAATAAHPTRHLRLRAPPGRPGI